MDERTGAKTKNFFIVDWQYKKWFRFNKRQVIIKDWYKTCVSYED